MTDITRTIQADGTDHTIHTVAGDTGTITLDGALGGGIAVLGDGDVHAVRSGSGHGSALRDGSGNGSAIRTGSGYGYAVRTDSGSGSAIRSDSGSGSAIRSGDGRGHARRSGDGHGDAHRSGSGLGDAVRSGSGLGDAIREGNGYAFCEAGARRLTSPTSGYTLYIDVQHGTVRCGCFTGTLDELTDPARDDLPPDHWAHKLTAENLATITQQEL